MPAFGAIGELALLNRSDARYATNHQVPPIEEYKTTIGRLQRKAEEERLRRIFIRACCQTNCCGVHRYRQRVCLSAALRILDWSPTYPERSEAFRTG